jgi:cell division control protein 6
MEMTLNIDVFYTFTDKTNSPKKTATPISQPKKVSLVHIANVVSDVYGSRIMAGSSGSQPTIPLQQKLLVCTLMLIMKQGKSKEVTIGKVRLSL